MRHRRYAPQCLTRQAHGAPPPTAFDRDQRHHVADAERVSIENASHGNRRRSRQRHGDQAPATSEPG